MRRRLRCAIGIGGIVPGEPGRPGMGRALAAAEYRAAALDMSRGRMKP